MECWLAVVFLFIASVSADLTFHVITPNILPLGTESSLAIAVDGTTSENTVHVIIQDYPQKTHTLVQQDISIGPGDPTILKVHLDPTKFPPEFLSDPYTKKFVSLTVKSIGFEKEVKIPIASQSGYVFIQTDKPIYTPKQIVHIRVITLNEKKLRSDKPFKLQIRDPNNIIMEEDTFNQRNPSSRDFTTKKFKFPSHPILGEWSAVAKFGHQFEQNSTVYFKLEEYVLPTFSVELTTPEVILSSHKEFHLSVTARYVYGENVKGLVTFRLGKQRDTEKIKFFAVIGPYQLDDEGKYSMPVSTKNFSKQIGWFPEIEGFRLVVEATVVDFASGKKEVTTKTNTKFSKSPFVISFARSLEDFRPGLMSVFEANIFYVDGTPAKNIKTRINVTVYDEHKQPLPQNNTHNITESDSEGKVHFLLHPEKNVVDMIIKLETVDPKYEDHQAISTFKQSSFRLSTKSKAFIALQRVVYYPKKVGAVFDRRLNIEQASMKDVYYTVISRGRILIAKKLPKGDFLEHQIKFTLTQEMVPHFRLFVWGHHEEELLTDSLLLETEHACHPDSEVSINTVFTTQEPGSQGKIVINGTQGATVGLLGVDKAVYLLSKKSVLTKTKMFSRFANHDLGCGPGGGLTTAQVIGRAGVILMTSFYNPPPDSSSICTHKARRKRDTNSEMLDSYEGLAKKCCALGMEQDKYNRTCDIRSNIIKEFFRGKREDCSSAFLDCCIRSFEEEDLGKIGEIHPNDPTFMPDEEMELLDIHVRKDFREMWFFTNIKIPFEKQFIFDVSLPQSITTWVVHAVSLSSDGHMCVAEPKEIRSFKKTFIQLNLPYSVVRNEQVEIRATVFNYGDKKMKTTVLMYGVKGLCSEAGGEGTNKTVRLEIERESAASAIFPVIPLETGLFDIQIKSLSYEGSDAISRQLNVIAEGFPQKIDFSIKLDPTNQQKRQKSTFFKGIYNDSIDVTRNLQATAIRLKLPEDFVPGTAWCKITAIGNPLGPVVQLNFNPENLIQLPTGCCEQNMARLAPLVYSVKYLKAKKNISKDIEEKAYNFIRNGYKNVVSYRRKDGSYSAYTKRDPSTWLTAFVSKVFCQASTVVSIDETVMCSAVKWLVDQQAADGSYIENYPVYDTQMMGGITGKIPLTAFVLIAFQECDCKRYVKVLDTTRKKARNYLERNFAHLNGTLATAITTYALILSNSPIKKTALDKLNHLSKQDKDNNMRYWTTGSLAHDVEASSYALLSQVFINNITEANSIMNWLNSQQTSSSGFKSTQDTVIALQGMTQYLIDTNQPPLNLVSNISSSNDEKFKKVLTFNEENALVLQEINVQKVGGTLIVQTTGHGIGSLAVQLTYNVIQPPPDKQCKFDIVVNVTEKKETWKVEKKEDTLSEETSLSEIIENLRIFSEHYGKRKTTRIRRSLSSKDWKSSQSPIFSRMKRSEEKKDLALNISICTKYMGDNPTDMSIVEVGIFSGYKANEVDLRELKDSKLIDEYEITAVSVIFYLAKVPVDNYHCLQFSITRAYIVRNSQKSLVKVYDYYNPDITCTKSYSPGNGIPSLRTICTDSICQCAEGECPKRDPFEDIEVYDKDKQRKELMNMACGKYDFVWIGKVEREDKHDGFYNISYKIEEIVKEGIEKQINKRNFLMKESCETVRMVKGTKYLIMGKDGQQYENNFGGKWYRYILDKNSIIYEWGMSGKKELQRSLHYVTRKLLHEGCSL